MNRRAPITMKNLASSLAVSRTTISYALNPEWEKFGVARETRERVLQLAERLGYRRNRLAMGLRTRKSKSIGILIPFFMGGGEHDLMVGVETALGDEYTSWIASSRHSETRELRILQSFEERMADGLLVTPTGSVRTRRFLQQMLATRTPVVQVERYFPGLKTSIVEADNAQLGHLCTEHLLSLGHTRIAFIPSPYVHTGTMGRQNGYMKTMRAAGLEPWIADGSATAASPESGGGGHYAQLARKLLGTTPRPSAIVTNDFLSVFRTAKEMKVQCPRDLSIASFDLDGQADLHEHWQTPPTLALWSIERLGIEAAKLLLREMNGERRAPKHVRIPGRLLAGKSTAAPRKK